MRVKSGLPGPHEDQEGLAPPQYAAAVEVDEVPPPLGPVLSRILAELKQIRATLAGAHKPWYTVEEVGEATGRTPYTIRRWIKEGRIQATRVNGTGPRGRLLIAHAELSRLIAMGLGGEVPATLADGRRP